MTSRVLGSAAVIGIASLFCACGVRAGSTTLRSSVAPGDAILRPGTPTQTVSYDNVKFDVPASWPVFDLAADPRHCIRFDVHAVYLGHQGIEARCPARLLGRSEAIQVESLDAVARTHLLPLSAGQGAMSSQNGSGDVTIQPFSDTTRMLVASFKKLGVLVTISYTHDKSAAEQLLGTIRASR